MRLTLGRYSARLQERTTPAIGGILSDVFLAIALGYVGYTSISEIIIFDLHRLRIFPSVSPDLGTAPFAFRVCIAAAAILIYGLALRFPDGDETVGERLFAAVSTGPLAPRKLASTVISKFWPLVVEGVKLLREYFSIDSESIEKLTSSFRILPSQARFIPWLLFFVAWVLILGGVFITANLVSFSIVPVTPAPNAPPVFVPDISAYLALIALTLGWTGILTGATLANMGLLLIVVLFYFVNFPKIYSADIGAQTLLFYGYAAVFWSFSFLAALASPRPVNKGIRFITLWCLCGLATQLTTQAIQSNLLPHTEAYLAWIEASDWVTAGEVVVGLAAAGVLTLVTPHLTAVPVFVTLLSINLASIAVYQVMGVHEETAGVRAAAAYIQVHAAQVRIWSDVVWFALGANILDFAMNFSARTVQTIRRGLAAPWWPTVLILFCLVELVALAQYLELPPIFIRYSRFYFGLWQHTVITLLVLAAVCALIITRRFTVEWALALCGVWAFTFLVFLAVNGLSEEVGLLAVGTLLWELLNGASRMSLINRAPAWASGLLMIYLGALVVLATVIHFDLVAPSPFVPSALNHNFTQIGGFEALSLPILVYWLLARQGYANEFRTRQYIRALIVGGLVSCIAYAVRGHFGDANQIPLAGNLALLAFAQILMLLTALVSIRLERAAERIDAAVIALGCAFGFAIAYTFGLLYFAGSMLLFFDPVSIQAGNIGAKLEAITYPSDADLFVLNTIAPVATCIAALVLYGKSRSAPDWRQGLGACSVAAVVVLYAAPLYQGNFLWNASPMSPVIPDFRAFLYLGFAVLCGAYCIYRTLARDLDASDFAGPGSIRSAHQAPKIPRAG